MVPRLRLSALVISVATRNGYSRALSLVTQHPNFCVQALCRDLYRKLYRSCSDATARNPDWQSTGSAVPPWQSALPSHSFAIVNGRNWQTHRRKFRTWTRFSPPLSEPANTIAGSKAQGYRQENHREGHGNERSDKMMQLPFGERCRFFRIIDFTQLYRSEAAPARRHNQPGN